MKVSIIILNFNDLKNTLECLQTVNQIKKLKSLQVKIIIIDNGSKYNIKNKISRLRRDFSGQAKFKLIQNKENLGFAEGNNVGIKYALKNGSDYVLLLNNDTLVDKNLLIRLIKVIEGDQKIGIVSPKIYFAPGYEFHKSRYKSEERGKVIWYAGGKLDRQNTLASHRGVDEVDSGQYNQTRETDFATGCCMLIRKDVFDKVGFFDQNYFLYWEDIDFCQRTKKAGFKVIYHPQAILWHKNASSSGGAGEKTSVYYQTRNRMLFAFKYASLKAKLAVLKEGIGYLFKGSQWQKKAVSDFFLLRFGQIKFAEVA